MEEKDNLTAKEAYELISAGKGFLVDVREPEELEDFSLEYAINIPLDQLPWNMESLPQDKIIITTCASGVRAQRACELLKGSRLDSKYVEGPITAFAEA